MQLRQLIILSLKTLALSKIANMKETAVKVLHFSQCTTIFVLCSKFKMLKC